MTIAIETSPPPLGSFATAANQPWRATAATIDTSSFLGLRSLVGAAEKVAWLAVERLA